MVREVSPKQQCFDIVVLKTEMPEKPSGRQVLIGEQIVHRATVPIASLASLQLSNMRDRVKTVQASVAQVCMVQICAVHSQLIYQKANEPEGGSLCSNSS